MKALTPIRENHDKRYKKVQISNIVITREPPRLDNGVAFTPRNTPDRIVASFGEESPALILTKKSQGEKQSPFMTTREQRSGSRNLQRCLKLGAQDDKITGDADNEGRLSVSSLLLMQAIADSPAKETKLSQFSREQTPKPLPDSMILQN